MNRFDVVIELRALEPEDLDFLYRLENDPEVWQFSENQRPLSKNSLKKYLDHAHLDPFKIGQLRLVVTVDGESVGLVDLFDFKPKHGNAMIGVVIDPLHRNKGIGVEAVLLICDHAKSWLNCRQLAALVSESNRHSIRLFEKAGFQKIGVIQDWVSTPKGYENQIWYQKKIDEFDEE
ncbi:MAG: GNAT family N-acetyltransferase [Flavobacteriaceae bacterium]